jgi:hypothetical protein
VDGVGWLKVEKVERVRKRKRRRSGRGTERVEDLGAGKVLVSSW